MIEVPRQGILGWQLGPEKRASSWEAALLYRSLYALDSGFLCRERIGQVKLIFGYASAVVLFDGELRSESAIAKVV